MKEQTETREAIIARYQVDYDNIAAESMKIGKYI